MRENVLDGLGNLFGNFVCVLFFIVWFLGEVWMVNIKGGVPSNVWLLARVPVFFVALVTQRLCGAIG